MNVLFLEEFYLKNELIEILNKEKFTIYEKKIKNFKKEDINIIFTRLAHDLNKKFLTPYSSLTHIVTPTTGLSHVDLDFCKKNNIRVVSLKEHTNKLKTFTGTAELALTLMLSLNLKLNEVIRSTSNGEWDRNKYMSFQLYDKTLGIIGYGRLGEILSKYAFSLGMKIVSYDPYKQISSTFVRQVELKNLLESSDYISIHASYDISRNYHLIGRNEIDLLKENCIFVNTARGELVDLKYLIEKLKSNKLRGIGFDTVEGEPYIENELLSIQKKFNIIFTPHIGGCKFETTKEAEMMVFNFLMKIL